MLYIINIIKSEAGKKIYYYRVFDTCSDYSMLIKTDMLRRIILENNLSVVNAYIKDNKIIIKSWSNGTAIMVLTSKGAEKYSDNTGPKYVALAKENNTYKIVDFMGNINKINKNQLMDLVKLKEMANLDTLKNETEDVYEIIKDEEFSNLIESKYKIFTAKIMMLTYKSDTFDYEIENTEVRLKNYTGTTKNVIIPSFVTSIMDGTFTNIGLEMIEVHEGLKVIGSSALATAGLKTLDRIEIPETIRLIGYHAFWGNDKLIKPNHTLNTDRFKITNEEQ